MRRKKIPRSEAIALGLKQYFDGKRCPHGHLSPKLVVNYTCIRCLHEAWWAKRRVQRQQQKEARAEARRKAHGNYPLPATAAEAQALGLKKYFTGIPCKAGHVVERYVSGKRCVQCNKDTLKRLYECNPKKFRAHNAARAKKLYDRKGKHINRCLRLRRKTDAQYAIACLIRNRIKHAIAGRVKSKSAIEYLGCSVAEAKAHIESLFKPGMSWKNHGLHGWHIDHIIPVAAFDLTDEAQRYKAFHYTNLQPLWATENLVKNDSGHRRKLRKA